jgi:hypothetical protein
MFQRKKQGARLATAACALLLPFLALAASTTTYEGNLTPGNYDAVIPITLEMENDEGQLSGIGLALMPGSTPLTITGSKFGGMCDLTLHFASQQKSHLEGECTPERFEGTYKLFDTKGGKLRGLFRMTGKKTPAKQEAGQPEKDNDVGTSPGTLPGRSATACLKLKVACLSGCPRGDYNTEFLCANSCRRKEAACKGKGFSRFRAPPPTEPILIPDGSVEDN